MEIRKDRELYVLKQENNKYYVGHSTDLQKVVTDAKNGRGIAWLNKYKYIKVLACVPLPHSTEKEASTLVHERVCVIASKHGMNSVRGGIFSNADEISHSKLMQHHFYKNEISTIHLLADQMNFTIG